jgi:hypothetical protein
MFDSKKTSLFPVREKKPASAATSKPRPAFVQAGLKKKAETKSGNGALKYSTTGNAFVDQFGKLGSYKAPRAYSEIIKDCEALWAEDPLKTVRMIVYLRMITRPVQLLDKEVKLSVNQKGAELKHEGIMRMIWLSQKDPFAFARNIELFVAAGSWKDVITMLNYDLVHHGWNGRVLDWNILGGMLLHYLKEDHTRELIKKYLPSIKSNPNCKTVEAQADNIIAKYICWLLYKEEIPDQLPELNGSYYKRYRKLKSSGTAHEWQKLISQKKLDKLDFSTIHGRALSQLVRSKFLKRQGLQDKYTAWLKKPEAATIKYTGFVHELFQNLSQGTPMHEKETINRQFATLVEKGKSGDHQTPFIVVRDTSSSMGSAATGTNMSCYNVAKALALYFSAFLTGRFSDAWIEFNSDAQMHEWKGQTPVDKWLNDRSGFVGSTDFQSVIRLFAKIKKSGTPEEDFPTGILCISDSEFNPTQLGKTNVETALSELRKAGFSQQYVDNFVIVLWNLQSRYYGSGTGEKFETFGNTPNVYYFSGYSAATISFLTGKINNAAELVDAALDQELLQLIEL